MCSVFVCVNVCVSLPRFFLFCFATPFMGQHSMVLLFKHCVPCRVHSWRFVLFVLLLSVQSGCNPEQGSGHEVRRIKREVGTAPQTFCMCAVLTFLLVVYFAFRLTNFCFGRVQSQTC